jgi:hypothetical protein
MVSSVLYFVSTHRNMHPMMGDVVLGEKFLIQCYFTLDCKGLEVFLYSPVETLSILQNAALRLLVVWNS